ncbi:Uncharacterised protein [uncultured archaeon]|nr:Uncharacterised protein [uncultured archaeon]
MDEDGFAEELAEIRAAEKEKEKIIAQAKKEAEEIVAKANAEARKIGEKASAEAAVSEARMVEEARKGIEDEEKKIFEAAANESKRTMEMTVPLPFARKVAEEILE